MTEPETRQHIVDAAIAESLPPPLAEKFLARLAEVAEARARAITGTNPPPPLLTEGP